MMKVVRTVWSGGKAGDCIKSLPITIVYGIAITAMAFFTDPTISTLTSGTPSQNADLAGMSFPRRLGVRFHADYIKRFHLTGMQAKWQGYEDVNFEKSLGKDFYHEDLVSREGWAKYYFKGKFPKDVAYVKLEVLNPQTGMLIKTFYFKFTKSYQTSLDGRYFITDPVLDEKIVKNGILTELRPVEKNGKTVYKKGKVTFPGVRMKDISSNARKEKVELSAIIQTMTRYSEKPKMVFLVTPPHLMKSRLDKYQSKLAKWEERTAKKGSRYYYAAIYVWTKRDLLKKSMAEKNNLNYVVFWKNDLSDAREYLSNLFCEVSSST